MRSLRNNEDQAAAQGASEKFGGPSGTCGCWLLPEPAGDKQGTPLGGVTHVLNPPSSSGTAQLLLVFFCPPFLWLILDPTSFSHNHPPAPDANAPQNHVHGMGVTRQHRHVFQGGPRAPPALFNLLGGDTDPTLGVTLGSGWNK